MVGLCPWRAVRRALLGRLVVVGDWYNVSVGYRGLSVFVELTRFLTRVTRVLPLVARRDLRGDVHGMSRVVWLVGLGPLRLGGPTQARLFQG